MDHQKKSIRKDTLLFYIEIKTEVQIKNNNKLKRRIELIVHMVHGRAVVIPLLGEMSAKQTKGCLNSGEFAAAVKAHQINCYKQLYYRRGELCSPVFNSL